MAVAEHAVFRPPQGSLRLPLFLGAAGGAGLAFLLDIDAIPLFGLLGAVAAWLASAASHATGLRAVADEAGLRVLGPGQHPAVGLAARWEELRLGFGFASREDGMAQRYAVVADRRGRSFAFSDLSGQPACGSVQGADGRAVPVVDLREAAFLLGLVVQRTPAWQVIPETLLQDPPPAPAPGAPDVPAIDRGLPSTSGAPSRERGGRVGVLGLLLKLGTKIAGSAGKLGAGALKAVKTTNLGLAAASAAAYSVVFSWKFAVAILLQLFVHEYGHVHAMRRTGMKVRGMYFIPFLGAVAVHEDAFSSRRQQAYVALNGPLWGSLLALLPAGAWLATGEPVFAAVASWWALINLFNLLPISPLDGGRVMQAFAFSFSSGLGLAASAAGLALAVAVGSATGFSLLWFIALLGGFEMLSEAQARGGARALRLLPAPDRFGPLAWIYLRSALGPAPGGPGELRFLSGIERARAAGRAVPMTAGEMVRWGLGYAGLAAALVLLVWALRHVPGAGMAAGFLE
jgi:Zn-dependent protease